MNKFKVIVGDVYKKNVKTFSFWLMLLVPFIMAGVIFAVGYFASGGFGETTKIALVTEDETLAKSLTSALKDDFSFETTSKKEAQKALEAEDIDAYLEIAKDNTQVSGKLYATTSLGSTAEMTLSNFLSQYQQSLRIKELGLSPEKLAAASAPAEFSTEKISFEKGKEVADTSNEMLQFGVGFVMVILVFFVILTYSSIIAQEVASEKGTRIMEVILSSTTAQTHFYGKIVGVLLVALTQFAAYLVVGVVAWPFVKQQDFIAEILKGLDLSQIFGSFLVYNLLFFFGGVMIYSVLAALCGSLVSKTEDVPKAVIPITYLALAGYLIGISLGSGNPQSIVVKVTSFIPFLSSFTMPVRIATDTVSTSQIFISLAILLGTTVLLTLFSARMYKANVLIYSEGGIFKSLKQSFSIMKNEKAQ